MAKILGSDSEYRGFTPTYEYGIQRRQVLRVLEDTNRLMVGGTPAVLPADANAEFGRPLHFHWQNPNPMTCVRSARYRLPLQVTFRDQEGKNLSRDKAVKLAMRNRPSKIFNKTCSTTLYVNK